MTMTAANGLKWLRSGHYTENILIQVTHQGVIDTKAAEGNCLTSNQPILCGNDGILRISQTDFNGADGKYYGVITRATGLGDVFSGLLNAAPSVGAGSLDFILDGSPLMDEVASLKWDNSLIEIRTGEIGTEWADALQLFSGLIVDGEVKKHGNLMSFRVTGNEWRLKERFDPSAYDNLHASASPISRCGFGYCPKTPVYCVGNKSGSDYLYGATAWTAAETISYAMYDDTDNQTGHTDSLPDVIMTSSDSWATVGSVTTTPVNKVSAATKGYSVGGFVYRAGEILETAIGVLRGWDEDLNEIDSLADVTLDSASFTEYDTRANYKTGYMFDAKPTGWVEDDLQGLLPSGSSHVDGRTEWNHAFNHLVIGSGGLWCFNRENELSIHWLLGNPSGETEVATIHTYDFNKERSNWSEVDRIDRVESTFGWSFPDNTLDSTREDGASEYAILGTIATETINPTITDATQFEAYALDTLNRFGSRDYRLADCLIAKTLNVGDVVKIIDADDDFIGSSGVKGHVIGVDRGTKPFVEIRI